MRVAALLIAFCLAASTVSVADAWTPPEYNKTVIDAFFAKVLTVPLPQITADPYLNGSSPNSTYPETAVCAVLYEDDTVRVNYTLATFDTPEAAVAAGGHVTHQHPCGACSTLHDLAVYMSWKNMTAPVKACGEKFFWSVDLHIKCLLDMGFTQNCVMIWLYNTKVRVCCCLFVAVHRVAYTYAWGGIEKAVVCIAALHFLVLCRLVFNPLGQNTGRNCWYKCLDCLFDCYPYNLPDGSMKPCIACDEEISGPIFKKFAGRTRRDSGLSSAIWRPPQDIYQVEHYYY